MFVAYGLAFITSFISVNSLVIAPKDVTLLSPKSTDVALTTTTNSSTCKKYGDRSHIKYFQKGAPVLNNDLNVYVIWYGDWNNDLASVDLIEEFLSSVGDSDWIGIQSEYYETNRVGRNRQFVSTRITLVDSIYDKYSQGAYLYDSSVEQIVRRAIATGRLKKDLNGVYFVLTSSDVEQELFCSYACGWHYYYDTMDYEKIKYAWIGDPSVQCPSACSITTETPNGLLGADAMISVIAHELTEVASDPLISAWMDYYGNENADKCAWHFGDTYSAPNGAPANMNINGFDYLIQQNWVRSKQCCALSL